MYIEVKHFCFNELFDYKYKLQYEQQLFPRNATGQKITNIQEGEMQTVNYFRLKKGKKVLLNLHKRDYCFYGGHLTATHANVKVFLIVTIEFRENF